MKETNQEIKPGEGEYLLGRMFLNGDLISAPNRRKAFIHLKKAAKEKHTEAMLALAEMYKYTNEDLSLKYLKDAHSLGDLRATRQLVDYCTESISESSATYYLSILYAFGWSDNGDIEFRLGSNLKLFFMMQPFFARVFKSNFPDAVFKISEYDSSVVVDLFDQASLKGHIKATEWLARLFAEEEYNMYVAKDIYRAIEILKRQEYRFQYHIKELTIRAQK